MPPVIQISAQYGCPLSSDAFWPMHRRLNELFESRLRRDYGKQVNLLAIILRVSGELVDYGSVGPERLFYRRQGKYLEIDLAIPHEAWNEQPLDQVRTYLANGLKPLSECSRRG